MRVEVGASNTNADNAAQSLSRRERNARDDLQCQRLVKSGPAGARRWSRSERRPEPTPTALRNPCLVGNAGDDVSGLPP
jgi:hypothetical protein